MIIGITGRSGSGKTYLSKLLESIKNNTVSLNIDKVGHMVLLKEEVQVKLIKAIGIEILNDEGIDRRKLGKIVFSSEEQMKILEDITWPYMKDYIDEFIFENFDKTIILEWALLPNSHYFEMCNLKILVDVPYEIRLQRAIARDGIDEEAFKLRDRALKIDLDSYQYDYIIDNSTQENMKEMVEKLYGKSIIPG